MYGLMKSLAQFWNFWKIRDIYTLSGTVFELSRTNTIY